MRLARLCTVSALLLAPLLLSCSRLSSSLGGETPTLFPIQQDRKWGFINSKGNVVIQPQFERAFFFSEGLAAVCIENDKCGYIDETGKFVINPQFRAALRFAEGLAAVEVEGKIGYIDKTGKLVINPQFDAVHSDGFGLHTFSEGLARVKVGDKFGFIDKTGKIVINPQFEDASPFFEELAAVEIGGKYGFVDKTGKIVINPQFEDAQPFTNGLAAVRVGKQYGYIDKTGKIAINPQFDLAFPFSDGGLALVALNKKGGYVNKSGNYEINPQFVFQSMGPGGFGPDIWQLIFIFTPDIGRLSFSEGLAPAQVSEGKAGYVDKDGKFVINPQFALAFPFYGGIALVVSRDSSGEEMGWIDKEGKYVWRETREQAKGSDNVNATNANVSNANVTVTNANVTVTSNMNAATNMNTSAANVSTGPAGQRTGRLTTDANLRSDSNKDAASVGIQFRGAQVRILDETSYVRDNEVVHWYKIQVYKYGCSINANLGCGKNTPNDADQGWVNAKLVLLD
jgi:hypothetical protein